MITIQGTSKKYYELMILSVSKKGRGGDVGWGVADKRDRCSVHDLQKQTRKKTTENKVDQKTAANNKFVQSVIVVRHQNCSSIDAY